MTGAFDLEKKWSSEGVRHVANIIEVCRRRVLARPGEWQGDRGIHSLFTFCIAALVHNCKRDGGGMVVDVE